MKKIIIFGNSGSGKSTLANQLAGEGLSHLDLDILAWLSLNPPERRPLQEAYEQIDEFIRNHDAWVIEGCYADLLDLVKPFANEAIFMNLSIAQCQQNACNRPWEPHKYPSKQAQDDNLPMLLDWIAGYHQRDDVLSYPAHRALFERFQGKKSEITNLAVIKAAQQEPPPGMTDTVFETERLHVRRWRDADVSDMLAVYGDADAMKWVGDGRPISEEECYRWLDVTRRNYATRGYGMFAVELRSAPGVIGFCGLVHPDGQAMAEVKYAYLRRYWGQGLATEVLRGLISYAVTSHGLSHIIATTAPENHASHAVLIKAGMRRGELRADEDGGFTQVFEYRRA